MNCNEMKKREKQILIIAYKFNFQIQILHYKKTIIYTAIKSLRKNFILVRYILLANIYSISQT